MLHQSAPEGVFQRLFAPERGEGVRIVADIGAQVLRSYAGIWVTL